MFHILMRKTLKAGAVLVLTMVLTLTAFSPLLLHTDQAVAEIVDCTATGGTQELKYDDGEAYGQMWTHNLSGCDQCQTFQGVLFSLPEGVSSSILRKVSVYAGGGKASALIHIMDTQPNGFTPNERLIPKIGVTVSGEKWYELVLPDVVVPTKFWVFFECSSLKVVPFFDERRTGQSWNGKTPYRLVSEASKRPAGDFLIRAYIAPEATVGPGEDYDYATIQEAVDSVFEGWRITVDEGTYNENVTISKSVSIKSLMGPDKTIVRAVLTPFGEESVFTIRSNCVTLSGFTIEGATDAGGAGVRIEEAGGCVVSGNVIQDNGYGIYVSEGSEGNILLENECSYNATGIHIDGSANYISGNNLHGNTALQGSEVFLSSVASGNQLRFNTVTVDPGANPEAIQVYNEGAEEVRAIENWWGTDTGPRNVGGQGPRVGEMIRFDPWLSKQPVRVKTVAALAGPYTLDGRSETSTVVIKQGTGKAFASVASFAENPMGDFKYKTLDKWIDVVLSDSKGIDEVEIRVDYTDDEIVDLKEGSLRLFWWNGEKWKVCSKTGVDKDNDFVWARLTLKSKPACTDLTGTMFAVGVPKGGFAWWLIPLIIVLLIIGLVVIRLFWVLVVGRGRYAVD